MRVEVKEENAEKKDKFPFYRNILEKSIGFNFDRNILYKTTNTSINKLKEENSTILFPCLMIGDEDIIVLFTKPKCGVLIKTNWSNSGDYHEDWNMSRFKPFQGEIILSNK